MQFPYQILFYLLLLITSIPAQASVKPLSKNHNENSKNLKIEHCLKLSKQFYYANNSDSATYYAKKALLASKQIENDSLILKSQLELYYSYSLHHNNAKEIQRVLKQAEKIAYKIQDSTKISKIHLKFAYHYYETNKYDSAISNFTRCIALAKIIGHEQNKIEALIGLGQIYAERGNFEQALIKYIEASKNVTDIDEYVKLSLLIAMGNLYADDKQLGKAKSYYIQALDVCNQLNKPDNLSIIYNNLAIIYQDEHKYLKAKNYFLQSLKNERKIGSERGIALALNNIGHTYSQMGNYEKALEYLQKSSLTLRKLNCEVDLIYNLEALSQVYISTKNYEQAFKYLSEGIQLSKQLKIRRKRSDLLKLLAKYHSHLGNNKKAYTVLLAYNALKDSVQNESKSAKITQLQAKFESIKKEKANEILKIENKFTEELLAQEKTKSYFLYLFSFLTLSIIILIVILFRSKVKVHNNMKRVYRQLENSNAKLKVINATKDKFFSIIAHDLRSPFNAILGFSELLKEELNTSEKNAAIEEYSNAINESANGLYNLLENLLQWANNQRGLLKYSPEQFDLYELVQNNLGIFKLKTADKSIKLRSEIKPNTSVYGDMQMIDTVLRNLISNALKFTDYNGEVLLSAKFINELIYISVKDTGTGISKENQNKLFRIDHNFSSYGTDNEKGSGLGLILCKEFITKNGGEIWVESEIGKGSCFTVSLKSI